ncbi:MAG: hypothetical protein MJ157_00600 [Clostridia bacterium]|nr:hypothetical protein [Clostridia bacterium]
MGKKIFVSPVLTCLIIFLILAVLITLAISLIPSFSHKEFISSNQGLIIKTETRSGFLASMTNKNRQYTFSDGNNFRQEQVKFKNSSKDPVKLATYTLFIITKMNKDGLKILYSPELFRSKLYI